MFNCVVKMPLKSAEHQNNVTHAVDSCIVDLTYFAHSFHAFFLNFTYILHIDASLLTPDK